MSLDLSRLTDCLAWTFGAGESEIAYVAARMCNEKSVILDVGATIGTTTLFFAHLASHGKVYSFEPSTNMHKALERNIASNRFSNVRIYPYGLGDRVATGHLECTMAGNPGSAFFVEDSQAPERELQTI